METLVCPLVAFGLSYNTLRAGFVYDDKRAVVENPDVTSNSSRALGDLMLNDFWGERLTSNHSHGSYRPLTVLTFRWTHAWIGRLDWEGAFWYHLTNLLLHSLVTLLVTALARRTFQSGDNRKTPIWISSLLFAAHPVHCEAVASLVGRADVLCTLFFLAGFMTHVDGGHNQPRNRNLPLTVGLAAAAFLAKEYGVMLLPVCILYDLLFLHRPHLLEAKQGRNRIGRNGFILGSSFLFFLVIRLYLCGFRTPRFAEADNPTARSPCWITRTLTFFYLPVFHFGLLLWPHWLSFDWSMSAIPAITSLADWRNLASLLFYTSLILAGRRLIPKRRPHISPEQHQWKSLSIPFLLITLPFLPATNLLTYVGFVAAERILYLPSVGFCLLVGAGADHFFMNINSQRQARGGSLSRTKIILIGCWALLLSAMAYRTLRRSQDWIDEELLYRSAIPINPPKAYANLGVILQAKGRFTEAEWSYKQAIIHRPNMADVHFNLANLYQEENRLQEALRLYDKAIHFRPGLAEAYHQKAKVLDKLGRWIEAENALLKCVQLSSEGVKDHASHLRSKTSAAILLAQILNRNGSRIQEAEKWLLSANDPAAYHRLGELLSQSLRYDEAAEVMIKAAKLQPDSIAYTVSAAHALHEAHRDTEAEIYFRRAATLDPKDVSLQVNLGAVLHVQGKLGEAERVYLQVLEKEPDHRLTLINLRRLQESRNRSRSCATDGSRC